MVHDAGHMLKQNGKEHLHHKLRKGVTAHHTSANGHKRTAAVEACTVLRVCMMIYLLQQSCDNLTVTCVYT